MRRFLLKIFFFLSPLFLSMYWLGQKDNIGRNDQPWDFRRLQASSTFDSLDCLFVGSSHTYSAVNPRTFDDLGWRTFNLSISGTGVYFLDLVLEDYLRTKQPPKRLVIDVSHMTFSTFSDNWTAYPIHRYLNTPVSHEALVLRYSAVRDYYAMFRKSALKGLKNMCTTVKIEDWRTTEDSLLYYRGFYRNCKVQDAGELKKVDPFLAPLKSVSFDEKKFSFFLKLVHHYHKKGIKVYWFSSPTQNLDQYFSRTFNLRHAEAIKQLQSNEAIKEIVIDYTDFEFNDFRNIDHLNCIGAEKLSLQLKNRLAL